jgi:single-strand DNA-binding protein
MIVETVHGNIARDLDLKQGDKGAWMNLTVAVNCGKDKDAIFRDCIVFGRNAELIHQYKKKGEPILVAGTLESDNYENKEGKKVYKNKLRVTGFDFISAPAAEPEGQPVKNDDIFSEEPPF